MNYLELLEHSYRMELRDIPELTRLEYLAMNIFDFTTYDGAVSELFATKALEVCKALNEGSTLSYIRQSDDDYRWYLLMVNMPFFDGRLSWGTSIRGAWWNHSPLPPLKSCGVYRDGKQVLSLSFTRDEWVAFIDTMLTFAGLVPAQGGGQ